MMTSPFAPTLVTPTATIRDGALQRLPQCVFELLETKSLNSFGKRERRERLEHDIIGAVAVAPLVEQTTFKQRYQKRDPKEYRKGVGPLGLLNRSYPS